MALSYKNDSKADERLNPYNDTPNPEQTGGLLNNREQQAAGDTASNYSEETPSSKKVDGGEKNPNAGWSTNLSKQSDNDKDPFANIPTGSNPLTNIALRVRAASKKHGPLGAVTGLFAGLIALISFFGAPGLLLVHISEIITNKTDYQVGSADRRHRAIVNSQIDGATAGFCNKVASYKCRYSSMGKWQIDAYRRAVEGEGGRLIMSDNTGPFGRERIAAIELADGRQIDARNLRSEARGNAAVHRIMINAYNLRFITKFDAVYNSVAGRTGLTKRSTLNDAKDDAERRKRVVDSTHQGQRVVSLRNVEIDENCTPKPACVSDQRELQRATNEANNMQDKVQKNATEKIKAAKPSFFTSGVRTLNTLDVAGTACIIPEADQAISYGAKTVRSVQLMRFAMLFLTAASEIKAGTANPATIAFLGAMLTTTFTNSDGTSTKSGTEAFGLRNLMYGDTGVTDSATLALVGGGLGGNFSGIVRTVYGSIPGGRGYCKTMANPFVQAGGVLLTFVPFFGQGSKVASQGVKAFIQSTVRSRIGQQIGRQVTFELALSAIVSHMISVATDLASGVIVAEDTFGEEAGDLLASGGHELHTQMAGEGGNLALTKAQAGAYLKENQAVIAKYTEHERAERSPFDISSPYTALGSIYTQMIPHVYGSKSLASAIGSLQKLSVVSLASFISPTTQAVTSEASDECEDYDYQEMNIATGPMCHIIRGIPVDFLDKPPVEVGEILEARNHIDEDGTPVSSEYRSLIEECFKGKPITLDDGGDICVAKPTSAGGNQPNTAAAADNINNLRIWMAVHYIDERLSETMENGLPAPEALATANPSTDPDSGVVSGDARELAQKILDSQNVTYWDQSRDAGDRSRPSDNLRSIANGEMANTSTRGHAGGKKVSIDIRILQFLAELSTTSSFIITSLAGQRHSSATSDHYTGRAVDLGCTHDVQVADAIARKYALSRNSETCADDQHWHYRPDQSLEGSRSGGL